MRGTPFALGCPRDPVVAAIALNCAVVLPARVTVYLLLTLRFVDPVI